MAMFSFSIEVTARCIAACTVRVRKESICCAGGSGGAGASRPQPARTALAAARSTSIGALNLVMVASSDPRELALHFGFAGLDLVPLQGGIGLELRHAGGQRLLRFKQRRQAAAQLQDPALQGGADGLL